MSVKYQQARQAILDYLLQHPGTLCVHLGFALQMAPNTCKHRIAEMIKLGEVRREQSTESGVSATGKRTARRVFMLFAEKRVAAYVETHYKHYKVGKQPPKVKTIGPNGGRINTRFDDPHAKPYRNQGGQGTIGVQPRGVCTMLGE